MSKQLQPIDITHVPELARLADEASRSQTPRLLTRGDRPLALVTPVEDGPSARTRSRRRNRRTGPDDPLWAIIGIGDAAGSPDDPTDVSENVDRYLADAYAPPER